MAEPGSKPDHQLLPLGSGLQEEATSPGHRVGLLVLTGNTMPQGLLKTTDVGAHPVEILDAVDLG